MSTSGKVYITPLPFQGSLLPAATQLSLFTTSCLNNIDSHLIDLSFPGLYFLSPSLLSPHHLPSSFPSYLSSLPPSFLSLFLPPALLLSLFPLSLSLILSPLVEEEYAKYKIILGYKNLFSP